MFMYVDILLCVHFSIVNDAKFIERVIIISGKYMLKYLGQLNNNIGVNTEY